MPKKPNILTKKRLAIGVSGSGTTYEAIAKAIVQGDLNLELSFVFTDRKCKALEKAKIMGTKIVQRRESEDLNTFHERIIGLLKNEKVDIVALAGYLRLFPISSNDPFIVINSHPAAIPYFGGEGMWGHFVHDAVIDWAQKTNYSYPYTFSTIHIASAEYDRGDVLGIKRCILLITDNIDSLSSRLLPIEHENYLEVLNSLARGDMPKSYYPKEFVDLIE
jgi:phosphoribosylglycinamide formyltransferase-1